MSRPDDRLELAQLIEQLTRTHDETHQGPDGTTVRRIPPLLSLLRAEADHATAAVAGNTTPASRGPGYTPALELIDEIEHELEGELWRLALTIRPSLLDNVRALNGLHGLPDERRITPIVRSWHSRTRITVGLDPAPILLPVKCPYCQQVSVLASRTAAAAWCTTRGCTDGGGNRPEWEGESALRRLGRTIEPEEAWAAS